MWRKTGFCYIFLPGKNVPSWWFHQAFFLVQNWCFKVFIVTSNTYRRFLVELVMLIMGSLMSKGESSMIVIMFQPLTLWYQEISSILPVLFNNSGTGIWVILIKFVPSALANGMLQTWDIIGLLLVPVQLAQFRMTCLQHNLA